MSTDSQLTARPILLVEDNPMDIDLTLQSFEEHHVKNPVVVCRDGEEAMQYIDRHAGPGDPEFPILALLDLRLPKVDGLEVLRHARQQPGWKNAAIVVLTTSTENTDIAAARQFGATEYIVKPVDFAAFSEVVKQIRVRWLLVPDNTA
jgi:hypothetical protein